MNMLDITFIEPFEDQKYKGFFGRFRRSSKFFRTYLRNPFWLIFGIFIVVFAMTVVVSYVAKSQAFEFVSSIISDIFRGNGIIGSDNTISVVNLFLNNLRAACVSFILGFVPFLYLPTVSVLGNAIIAGLMVGYIGVGLNYDLLHSLLYVLAGIIPHGIFEIPALLLACAMGYAICTQLNKQIFRKRTKWPFDTMMGEMGWYIVLKIIPLLIIAACVETWLTPMLMRYVRF